MAHLGGSGLAGRENSIGFGPQAAKKLGKLRKGAKVRIEAKNNKVRK